MRLVDAAEALLAAGVRLVQLRWKSHWSPEALQEAGSVAALCRNAEAAFVVNDRADIALLLDAGVHVGQDDLPPSAARIVVGTGRFIGFSTHNETQFRAALAEPIDYVALGPIFGTASKLNPDPVVGVPEFERLASMSQLPVVAIGGITRETAPQVWRAGAASIAIVGDLYPEGCSERDIRRRAEEWVTLAEA